MPHVQFRSVDEMFGNNTDNYSDRVYRDARRCYKHNAGGRGGSRGSSHGGHSVSVTRREQHDNDDTIIEFIFTALIILFVIMIVSCWW